MVDPSGAPPFSFCRRLESEHSDEMAKSTLREFYGPHVDMTEVDRLLAAVVRDEMAGAMSPERAAGYAAMHDLIMRKPSPFPPRLALDKDKP